MKPLRACLGVAALACLLASPAAAQMFGRISGTVFDTNGKPWPGVTVVIQSKKTGQTFTVVTDKKGQYVQVGLVPGIYVVTLRTSDFTYVWGQAQVELGEGKPLDINLKEALAKNPQYLEQKKKQEEESKKFASLKAHFEAGVKALQQAEQTHTQALRALADQRTALEQQVASLDQTAVQELEQAQQLAGANNPNLHVILANLAKAYETAGKYDEAVASIQKAIELKPDQPSYYILLGTDLARVGKITEAGAACDKAAALDPGSAGVGWRNIGIVLINAGNMKAAVDPLRKAIQVDPKNPDGWYWLGSSLLAAMDYKQVGNKIEYIVQPGTADAFQKYLALAPNGPYAESAKQALAQLAVITQGTETSLTNKKMRKK